MDPPHGLTYYFDGSAEHGGIASSDEILNFTIHFECTELTDVEITISIPLAKDLEDFNPVVFAFKKMCSLPSVGLIVGTNEGKIKKKIASCFLSFKI